MSKDREDILINKYNRIVNLYIHSTNMYWKVYSVFLILMGLLLAGFAQILKFGLWYVIVYCIIGIIIAFIWMPVTRRNLVYAEIAEDLGRNIEKDLFNKEEMKEEIPEILGRNKEKDIFNKEEMKEIIPEIDIESDIRKRDWEREETIIGLGYFQSTQRILYHELKEKSEDSWVDKRYDSRFQRWLIKMGGGISFTSVLIPLLFFGIWIVLLILQIIMHWPEITSFIDTLSP